MDNALTKTLRAKDETDAFLRECVLAGEIRRLRRENAAYARGLSAIGPRASPDTSVKSPRRSGAICAG